MTDGPSLLLATHNPGKMRELGALLTGVRVLGLRDVGIDDLDEPFDTFVDNAVAKAVAASTLTGLPALADDSGLCVDALGGAPGVFSARFAGPHGDDAANRALLLARLGGVAGPDRGAEFRCVLALADVAGPLGPAGVVLVSGRCRGAIVEAPRGAGGFGYDPLFVPEGQGLTMAELSEADKHARSHRGQAVGRMLPVVRGYMASRGNAWHPEAGAVYRGR